jgi:peptidyl-prolyl cis-trans isomerase D
MEAVFSAGADARGEIAQTPQGYVVFNVTAVQPPTTPSFEAIRAQVEQEFKNQRAQQLLAEKTQQLSDRARSEHDLAKAAKALGAQLKTSDLVGVNDQVPDVGAMSGAGSAAFGLKPGEISGPINTGNAGVVMALEEKQEPPAEQMEASKERIRNSLLEQKRAEFFNMYVDNLRKQMEKERRIRVNQQLMEQLVRTSQAGD